MLYESHKQHFGHDNDRVLVWQAETRVMNPNVSEKVTQHEIESDPDGASAEWLAKFSDDLESAFSLEAIQTCVIPGRSEGESVVSWRRIQNPAAVRQRWCDCLARRGIPHPRRLILAGGDHEPSIKSKTQIAQGRDVRHWTREVSAVRYFKDVGTEVARSHS